MISPFSTLYTHRELFVRLLKRDIQSSFRGSALGLLWVVITPLVLVGIYSFVFGVILKSSWAVQTQTALDVPLLYFTGLMFFSFFMEILSRSPDFIRQNKSYVTKMIFPVEIMDWVLIGTATFKLVIALTLLILFMVLLTGRLPLTVLQVPILLFPFLMMMVGIAWVISALGTFIRDFSHVFTAIGPVLLFVSPVFYTVEQVPDVAQPFYYINPVTYIVESLRGVLFFDRTISWPAYGAYFLVSMLLMVGGFKFFQRVRPGFADVI